MVKPNFVLSLVLFIFCLFLIVLFVLFYLPLDKVLAQSETTVLTP
jgi:hypothetical protein